MQSNGNTKQLKSERNVNSYTLTETEKLLIAERSKFQTERKYHLYIIKDVIPSRDEKRIIDKLASLIGMKARMFKHYINAKASNNNLNLSPIQLKAINEFFGFKKESIINNNKNIYETATPPVSKSRRQNIVVEKENPT